MGIKVTRLSAPRQRTSSLECVEPGCGCGVRGQEGLGDPIMTLEGLGNLFTDLTEPRDSTIWTGIPMQRDADAPTLVDTTTLFSPMQRDGAQTSSAPPSGGSTLPDAFAPTDSPLPPPPPPPALPPSPPPQTQADEVAAQAAADGKAVKVAIGVGGALVVAALLVRGR